MIITWEGRDWPLDFTDLTVKQAEAIEAASGMTLEKWFGQLAEDASSIRILKTVYWLMHVQNGVHLKLAEVDFPVLRFGIAFAAAAAEEEPAGEPEPDPTTPRPAASAPSRAPSSRSKRKPATVTGGPDG